MSDDHSPPIRTDIPQSARIWNYWMGGKDYYEIDRIAGAAGVEVDPDITTMAVQSRQFLMRAARCPAGEESIRQFLEIGAGGTPYISRPRAEIRAVFDGLELVEPRFVSITQWRTDTAEVGEIRPISAYSAVAHKP
ncbi:SAM-dependent methyltransferase [Nocardia sp. NPDC051990]|uniref:SAM-dependent methyltransferase n=1 Tax=Nocardia sp. NPDC051990 TaxID=3155285 RepID=UPI00343A5580